MHRGGRAVRNLVWDALHQHATSVGLTLRPDGTIQVIAPHGLQDLFDIAVRRNPTRVSVATYRQRTASKRWAERWPQVRITPC